MRANKYAVFWTAGLTIVSFILCITLYSCRDSSIGLVYDLSLACFGSALLGCVVAYTAYNAERRDAMENAWQSAMKLANRIRSIPPLELPVTKELIKKAFIEEGDFFSSGEIYPQLAEWVAAETDDSEDKEIIEEKCRRILAESRQILTKIIKLYVQLAETDITELNMAYGKMDFIFANNTIREEYYNGIYTKIYMLRKQCADEKYHFTEYLADRGNAAVCLDKAMKIDEKLFRREDIQEYKVYRKLAYDLDHQLESFRSKIYDDTPQYEEESPIMTRIVPKPDNSSYEAFSENSSKSSELRLEDTRDFPAIDPRHL